MQYEYASSSSPTLSSTKKALLEIGRKEATKCLGEELYILSDPRESFEEQGYILIQKSFKKTQVI